MPTALDNHDTYDYAERIRARLQKNQSLTILLPPLMRFASLRAAFGCLLAFLILVWPAISASLRLSRFARLFCPIVP
jgi:hypothetical protein